MAAPSFLAAVTTIARRDITATVVSRGFLIWLAMPIIGLLFGLGASLAQGGGDERTRPPSSAAVIDTDGGYAPWLLETAKLSRTRERYAQLRGRFTRVRGDVPLPDALSRPARLLDEATLQDLSDEGRLKAIEAEFELGEGDVMQALGLAPTQLAFTQLEAEEDPRAQAERLLRRGSTRFGAVVIADEGRVSVLRSGDTDVERVSYLAGRAWERRALTEAGLAEPLAGLMSARPQITVQTIEEKAADQPAAATGNGGPLATGAAIVLFTLISLLAGALLSNMVEEKANKVIEILVASVPIPAIFAGKLIAMLFVSLLGVTVWGLMFGGGAAFLLGQLPAGILQDPARGWPQFIALVGAYFVTAYLIYGAIYLGIGSLCTSIREVQTLSMPVTILQMVILIGTLGAIDNPAGTGALIASWFPLSAPYMMAARAGLDAELMPHLIAIAWQLVFAGLVILVSARLFRYGVLRSGPPPSVMHLFRNFKFRSRKAAAEKAAT
ncbi:ABC transporter permease [Pacificimonas sp. WHA3]|uniref:ABC transporter permease n=1 Tax=Pacificimonas pallii TaxID=2827236 RepID=A0ABS6SBW5_9SPHN|nr:ABC transporter permease [Pacificimonas pallii]MBV7255816.1 ABC transporter permease [Pacificimonas pallii]